MRDFMGTPSVSELIRWAKYAGAAVLLVGAGAVALFVWAGVL